MSHYDAVLLALRLLLQDVRAAIPHMHIILGAGPITIEQFFTSLYGKLTAVAVAVSTFFFAWAALLYGASGTSNDRAKQHAQAALYAALVGLALALLAGVIAGLVGNSAGG